MGISLALGRISRLLLILGNPHISGYKSIHIAGTNGKGSTVAYISSILTRAHIRQGRFTSPHLLYYNDCISIDNQTYPLGKFNEVSELVKRENSTHGIGCTEFELLTVTAFKIFEIEKVEYAVIEVGLGGRLDATNVLLPYDKAKQLQKGGVIACGITKIGIDHENFLGSTFTQIASEKAGIIKEGIPVVVDATNHKDVIKVVQEKAKSVGSEVFLVDGESVGSGVNDFANYTLKDIQKLREQSPLKGNYQLQNLCVALRIVELLNSRYGLNIGNQSIEKGIQSVVWPGRLQSVQYKGIEMLIDGAHNESAALELKGFLDTHREEDGFIFVIALSKGKSIQNLVKYISRRDTDVLLPSKFSKPEGMGWVSSYDVSEVLEVAKSYFKEVVETTNDQSVQDILDIVVDMKNKGDKRKVIVCGSLYLCSDVLRLVNSKYN